MSRCTGHCCRRVIVQFSPYELARCKQSIENGTMKFTLDSGREFKHNYGLEEITKVHDMLLWLGTSLVDPATGEALSTPEHNYTCRHHDAETGDCRNYANRPVMCSSYPYKRVCKYVGCTHECSLEHLRAVAAGRVKAEVLDSNEVGS